MKESNRLNLTSVDVHKFTYNKNFRTFTTNISDLYPLTIKDLLRRMYVDSMDVGFTMINSDTGNSVDFYFSEADRNNEDEVFGWRFESNDLNKYKVLIIND